MNYIIKHSNGDWTRIQSPLTIEDLFAYIKRNEERYILFNEDDNIIFIGTDYLSNCIIVNAEDLEPTGRDEMTISDYF